MIPTSDDYLADTILRIWFDDISREMKRLAAERRPMKQGRWAGQQEPGVRSISMVTRIREYAVKMRRRRRS
jgi:hypothetical protein